ncbi:MAG: hypothetical protein A3J24_09315 [Deltaproteobacteria bacterium RIFCSPLOWO2_02_FULL_53_8]|nr:MAG: hypothetical protein A3J24_09315 [Deltaproteobacteria bacterium RIFCSPLOWO2_02_FULL_53_8]
MKVFTGAVRIKSTAKTEEVNITAQVEALLSESGITEGMALVSTGHTTASVHTSNPDKDLEADFQELLGGLVANKPTYRHNKGDYGRNADAHLKSILVGNSVTIPVTKGRLALGQWQVIYFAEFDGPRSRLISVKVLGIADNR